MILRLFALLSICIISSLIPANLYSQTTEPLRTFTGHAAAIRAVAFSPDGSRIATAGLQGYNETGGALGGIVDIWDTSTGELIGVIQAHTYPISSVAFSPDGFRLLTAASNDSNAYLWNAWTGSLTHTFVDPYGAPRSATFSPDGLRVLIGGRGGSFPAASLWNAWSVQTGSLLKVFEHDLPPGTEFPGLPPTSSYGQSVAFSPDGSRILTGGSGKATLWDNAGKVIRSFEEQAERVSSVAFSPDGTQILTGGQYNYYSGGQRVLALLWDVETGEILRSFEGQSDIETRSVSFSPDGKFVLTGGDHHVGRVIGIARLWDAQTGEEIRTFEGFDQRVNAVAFSPSGTQVLAAGDDGTARLWDISDIATPVPTPAISYNIADLNRDGVVDSLDLLIFKSQWGFGKEGFIPNDRDDTPIPTATPAPPSPIPTPTPVPQPGETITIPLNLPEGATPLELVRIPAGEFIMGSPMDEIGRFSPEGPQRHVTISRDFFIGKFPVTQAQYEAVMGSNPSRFTEGNTNNRPVEQVSWHNAARFCNRLSELMGYQPVYTESGDWPADMDANGFRLPTEAEWEYACRAGSTTRFYWGNDPNLTQIGNYAWYSGNYTGQTHDVGLKLPNAFGLFDMSGNVYEWCQDWYETYPDHDQVDPLGPITGSSISSKAYRGGSYRYESRYCRSANRYGNSPTFSIDTVGFRVVLPVSP